MMDNFDMAFFFEKIGIPKEHIKGELNDWGSWR